MVWQTRETKKGQNLLKNIYDGLPKQFKKVWMSAAIFTGRFWIILSGTRVSGPDSALWRWIIKLWSGKYARVRGNIKRLLKTAFKTYRPSENAKILFPELVKG